MSIPVPFGQYVPGDSPVHRIEPRIKLGVVAAFVTALFIVHSWWGFAVCAVLVGSAIVLSGVRFRRVARGLSPVLLILVFTLAANALRFSATDALVTLGPVSVSASGLQTGLFFAVRIVLLMLATTLLTLTTSPVSLTDAMARLLAPTERIGVPATDIATMLSVAMRFIPITAEEAERIIVAQTARGARFDDGGLIARGRAYVPVLVPLFVQLFRRAETLALAMDARGYRGTGRTRLNESPIRPVDWLVLAGAIVVATAVAIYL